MNWLWLVFLAVALSAFVIAAVQLSFPRLGSPTNRVDGAFRLEKKLHAQVFKVLRAREIMECALLFLIVGLGLNALAIAVSLHLDGASSAGDVDELRLFSEARRVFLDPLVPERSALGGWGWAGRALLGFILCAGLLLIRFGSPVRERARELRDYFAIDRISASASALVGSLLEPKQALLMEPGFGELAVQRTAAALWRANLPASRQALIGYLSSLDIPGAAGPLWPVYVGPRPLSSKAAATLLFIGILLILIQLTRVIPL